jgi:hypothetical protein
MARQCECCDGGCPCGGDCGQRATTVLFRVDMDDATGKGV